MERLACGIILTSHGIKGECKVKSLSGEVDHFHRIHEVYLLKNNQETKRIVEKVRVIHNVLLLKLKGIESPEDAKAIAGSEIWIDREFACPLDDNEYYYADLMGCMVHRGEEQIGSVRAIIETGAVPLLEITRDAGKTILCPFNKRNILKVDMIVRTIILTEEAEIN